MGQREVRPTTSGFRRERRALRLPTFISFCRLCGVLRARKSAASLRRSISDSVGSRPLGSSAMPAIHNPKPTTRPPLVCIFCGATKDISEEHIFSKWMRKYLPHTNFHHHHSRVMPGPNIPGKSHVKNYRGGTNVIRPKVVCRKCNNGWMSIIETNAKECLIPLMTGGSFTVTDDHKLKLSRWATLKTMVYEYQTEDFPLVSSTEDREKFRKDITPGDRWGVWIGRCQAPEWRARTMMQAYRLRPVDVEVPKIRNVETFTIALNELLIHIRLQ